MKKITLGKILEEFPAKHEVEQVMLISRYSCGCITTVTYAGFLVSGFSDKDTVSDGKYLWSDSNGCKEKHSISFEEVEYLDRRDLKTLAAEMSGFNSILVSQGFSDRNKEQKNKR